MHQECVAGSHTTRRSTTNRDDIKNHKHTYKGVQCALGELASACLSVPIQSGRQVIRCIQKPTANPFINHQATVEDYSSHCDSREGCKRNHICHIRAFPPQTSAKYASAKHVPHQLKRRSNVYVVFNHPLNFQPYEIKGRSRERAL